MQHQIKTELQKKSLISQPAGNIFNKNQLNSPSLASLRGFLMKAENLANTSIPAVLDSGCFAANFGYLKKMYQG